MGKIKLSKNLTGKYLVDSQEASSKIFRALGLDGINLKTGTTIKLSGFETAPKIYFYIPYRHDWIFDNEGNPLRLKRKYGKYNRLRSKRALKKNGK